MKPEGGWIADAREDEDVAAELAAAPAAAQVDAVREDDVPTSLEVELAALRDG